MEIEILHGLKSHLKSKSMIKTLLKINSKDTGKFLSNQHVYVAFYMQERQLFYVILDGPFFFFFLDLLFLLLTLLRLKLNEKSKGSCKGQ